MSDIMDDQDRVEFREKCQKILDVFGTPDVSGRSYEDLSMKIAYFSNPNDLALEVTIKPEAHPDNQHNPCVMVDKSGECIRHHGEWIHLQAHVNAVYNDVIYEYINHERFKEQVENRLLTTAGISQYVYLYISTKEERQKIHDAGIFSIVEILKGNYYAEQAKMIAPILHSWNERLGFDLFFQYGFISE